MSSDDRWQHAIDSFLTYQEVARQLSPHTLSNYRRDLEKFADYCRHRTIVDHHHAHNSDVRQWIALLHRNGLSGTSLGRLLSSLRSFYKYSNKQGGDHNPAIGIKVPRGEKRLPKTLDIDSMQQFLSIDGDDWLTVRDRAILELFYSSGLRLSELVDMDTEDLDLQNGLIIVTGKGRKTRTLPVGSHAIAALKNWFSVRSDAHPINNAAFVSAKGTRLGQRGIQQRLKKYSLQQGLGQKIHPHMLRHSFASHMLESSGDLRAVQELLGHANITTTQVYTHLDFQHLAKVYDTAHPRAVRKKPKESAP